MHCTVKAVQCIEGFKAVHCICKMNLKYNRAQLSIMSSQCFYIASISEKNPNLSEQRRLEHITLNEKNIYLTSALSL